MAPAFNAWGIAPPSVVVYTVHNIDAYKFRIVMSQEDLQKSGLDEIGKQWA